MKKAMLAAQQEAEHYKGLNETLLWISKKRANAERGLRPKTEHSGYAVLSSGETEYVYYTAGNKNRVKNTVMLWETVMQTPFSTDFSESQVKRESSALFVLDANKRWEIGKIGITARYKGGYEKMLQDEKADFWLSHNVLLKTRYKANWKAGYWEMVFLHTRSLPGVPEEYRLPTKEKKDKGPKEMKQPKNNKVVPKITDEEGE